MSLEESNKKYLNTCELHLNQIYKKKYGEDSSFAIRNEKSFAEICNRAILKNKPLLQKYVQKLQALKSKQDMKKNI